VGNVIAANSGSGDLATLVDHFAVNAGVEPAVATAIPEQAVHSSQVASVSETVDEPASVEPGSLMAMIPWAAPQSATVADLPNAAVVLGELPQVHFASALNPGREHNFEGGVEVESAISMTTTVVADEPVAVAQVSPVSPREVRRNRLLSTMVVADNNSDAERLRSGQGREVLMSSLDEDRLYDSVRRVGMVGDRLTLKF
jgi:hypothetical protein